ncbi:MAG TPA: type IV pilus biogenesis/stability protein PilW [Methylibium sp.]|uniref:type IV pilus biogenesis/stability protein PilW n=1 Tax=Methylibium sp. TaxID=2067992 RepID=UPI002DBD2E8D|nr:type IV pilus biogenesis/stability protein PilW [Methylibium sp.]HEU4460232.1 type IV pilus biogenesis/stability protein PilW [Methylibium sp.]
MTPTEAIRSTFAALAGVAALLLAACGSTPPRNDYTPPQRTAAPPSAAQAETADSDRRAGLRLDLAAAYYADGRYDVALNEVKRALDANPDLPQALNLRGLILAALGDEALATQSFKRALELAPNDADTMHNFGWYLCQRGRYGEAEAMFQRAVAAPQYRNANRTMLAQGVCEARAGQLDKAEATLKRAYELDAGNPATAMNLADVLYRKGDYERARFYVRRVNGNAELRNPESLWLAARVERRLGNPQGMRDFGNQLRASYPQSREALAFERGAFDE